MRHAARIDVGLAIPLRDGKTLVARRPAATHLGGFWEFPGGKVASGEEPADTARRELAEETGLQAATLDPLLVVVHDYDDRPLRLHVFVAAVPSGPVCMDAAREFAWVGYEELLELRMPEANRQMVRALGWRLGRGSTRRERTP